MNIRLMMKKTALFLLIICSHPFFSQSTETLLITSNSVFKKLKLHDSVTFYQCHVESGTQQLSTASGQTITGTEQKYTITEKFVLIKQENAYSMVYYISSLNIFPNKKFSGIKFKEKPYWDFKKVNTRILQEKELKPFVALEQKGRDAVVYDYAVTKYTTNQLIIRYTDDYKQLIIDGAYVLSKLMNISQ